MTQQTTLAPGLKTKSQFRCVGCSAINEQPGGGFRCSSCGDLLEIFYSGTDKGELPDPAFLRNLWLQRRMSPLSLDQSGVWRYREMLPQEVDWAEVVTLREGNTPLYELPHCAQSSGLERLAAKHQGLNPTGSFKDTGMTVAVSVAKQQRFRWVACASTGNTSASMAAYAARAGLRSLVLIPQGKISWGKLSQALDYGALTCELNSDFDGCMRVLNQVVERMPVYLLNSVNPYRIEGQKTAAVELMEQLGWRVPDHVIVPGGNLGNSSALGKAFFEMRQLDLIPALPRISVIQAEGANALVRTVRETGGKKLVTVQPETLASAIRIGNPASWRKAVRVIENTGGTVEQVSELEIAVAKAEIGADGIGCEPASAVTLAGLKKLVTSGFVKRQETVVLILTGHLLKDPEFTLRFHRGELLPADDNNNAALRSVRRTPIVLDASPDAVIRALEEAERS